MALSRQAHSVDLTDPVLPSRLRPQDPLANPKVITRTLYISIPEIYHLKGKDESNKEKDQSRMTGVGDEVAVDRRSPAKTDEWKKKS